MKKPYKYKKKYTGKLNRISKNVFKNLINIDWNFQQKIIIINCKNKISN
jgi:hypothetical protein